MGLEIDKSKKKQDIDKKVSQIVERSSNLVSIDDMGELKHEIEMIHVMTKAVLLHIEGLEIIEDIGNIGK